jgi:hypothetical protein
VKTPNEKLFRLFFFLFFFLHRGLFVRILFFVFFLIFVIGNCDQMNGMSLPPGSVLYNAGVKLLPGGASKSD